MNKDLIREKIIKANNSYRSGNPIMTDQEFDDLCEEYKKLVSDEEYSKFRDSLNEGSIETGKKIKHVYIAGSLDKLKYEEPNTIKTFIKKYIKTDMSVSAKIDGLTGIAHYRKGKLIGFSSRGDGYIGQDLFEKAKYIDSIPKTISVEDNLYIRGELVILKENYDKITGSSPRNIVAGLVNRKEYNPEDLKYISFVTYTIMGPDFSKYQQFDILHKLGFNVVWNMIIDKDECSSDDIVEKLFGIATMNFKYQTDGLVLSDTRYYNEEKYRPDSQVAFKTNQQKVQTRLIDVEWQGPSKDGRFSPIGILEGVEVGGVTVSKCTIHNLDFIKEHNLKIGDTISLIRSGDVIPKLIDVVSSYENSVDIEFPKVCSCCGSELVIEGPFIYCKNPECKDKTTYQVMHFIKKCGVEYASFKTLKNFGIHTFNNLLSFKSNKSYKSEVKLENEIYNKVFTLSKKDIFCKLNMQDIGETLLKKIVDFYSFEKIESGEFEKNSLLNLPEGIGEITMNKFLDEYKKNLEIMKKIISDSRYHYSNDKNTDKPKNKELVGSVCFTGSLNTMSRNEASKLAESNGYEVKSSVTKGLTYLITNTPDSGSSKNKKAQQLGTKIITEEEFLKLMNNNAINIEDI